MKNTLGGLNRFQSQAALIIFLEPTFPVLSVSSEKSLNQVTSLLRRKEFKPGYLSVSGERSLNHAGYLSVSGEKILNQVISLLRRKD